MGDDFIKAVRAMREHQKAFFKGDRSRPRLAASKAAEKAVDKMLAAMAEPPKVDPRQVDMFGDVEPR